MSDELEATAPDEMNRRIREELARRRAGRRVTEGDNDEEKRPDAIQRLVDRLARRGGTGE